MNQKTLSKAITECIHLALTDEINIDKDLKSARHKEIAKEYLNLNENTRYNGEFDDKLMYDICELWNEVKCN